MGILDHQHYGYSKMADELLLLQFCTKEFPDSYEAFYSLSKARSRLGGREQAIQNYRKSLELKPDFTDAVQLLDSLKQ
jgi:hypothetical protein